MFLSDSDRFRFVIQCTCHTDSVIDGSNHHTSCEAIPSERKEERCISLEKELVHDVSVRRVKVAVTNGKREGVRKKITCDILSHVCTPGDLLCCVERAMAGWKKLSYEAIQTTKDVRGEK